MASKICSDVFPYAILYMNNLDPNSRIYDREYHFIVPQSNQCFFSLREKYGLRNPWRYVLWGISLRYRWRLLSLPSRPPPPISISVYFITFRVPKIQICFPNPPRDGFNFGTGVLKRVKVVVVVGDDWNEFTHLVSDDVGPVPLLRSAAGYIRSNGRKAD